MISSFSPCRTVGFLRLLCFPFLFCLDCLMFTAFTIPSIFPTLTVFCSPPSTIPPVFLLLTHSCSPLSLSFLSSLPRLSLVIRLYYPVYLLCLPLLSYPDLTILSVFPTQTVCSLLPALAAIWQFHPSSEVTYFLCQLLLAYSLSPCFSISFFFFFFGLLNKILRFILLFPPTLKSSVNELWSKMEKKKQSK